MGLILVLGIQTLLLWIYSGVLAYLHEDSMKIFVFLLDILIVVLIIAIVITLISPSASFYEEEKLLSGISKKISQFFLNVGIGALIAVVYPVFLIVNWNTPK